MVARSGRRLAGYLFFFRHGRCNDGSPYVDTIVGRVLGAGELDKQGRVAYVGHYRRAFNFDRHGHRVNGQEFFRIAATFSGQRATGIVTDRFIAPRLRCRSGPMSFVIYLDGTPQAPLRDQWVASGPYRGLVGEQTPPNPGRPPRRTFRLDAFLPWRLVNLKLHWDLACGARSIKETATYAKLPIVYSTDGHTPEFRLRQHGTAHLGHRIIARWKSSLYGMFTGPQPPSSGGPFYRVTGDLNYNVTFFRAGYQIGFCQQELGFRGTGPHS